MCFRQIAKSGIVTLLLFAPALSPALEVDIQGETITTDRPGNTCIDLTGSYSGFTVKSSETGKIPQVCFSSARQNFLTLKYVTFVADEPTEKDLVVSFQHQFPPGLNGLVMARVQLNGFFSTPTGVSAATGDHVSFKGYFIQSGNEDTIGEPFDHTVGDEMESAVFKFRTKKRYLISGERILKGVFKINFSKSKRNLTLPDNNWISVDRGARFEDKVDTMSGDSTDVHEFR